MKRKAEARIFPHFGLEYILYQWPTLSLNLINDRTYRYELSAI